MNEHLPEGRIKRNVHLPDGRIIRNVPDGTSKADLIAKLRSNGYDVSNLGGAGASGAGASAREIPTTYNGELAPRDEYTRIVPPGSTTSREPEPEPEELRARPRSLGGRPARGRPKAVGGRPARGRRSRGGRPVRGMSRARELAHARWSRARECA